MLSTMRSAIKNLGICILQFLVKPKLIKLYTQLNQRDLNVDEQFIVLLNYYNLIYNKDYYIDYD